MSLNKDGQAKIKYLDCGDSVLPVKLFPLKKMVQYAAICMIAKRGSGKSWIVRSLLYHFKDIPVGAIICPTDEVNPFYGTVVPELYIHYQFTNELITNILNRQKRIKVRYDEHLKKGDIIDPRAFIVMDDLLADKNSWVNDPTVRTLLMNGRHYKIMFILTMQTCLGIRPELREQFDYIFLLKSNKVSEQKKIYEHYAGIFPSFNVFRDIYNHLTQDFCAMVINNRGNGDNFLENIYWYKAKKIDDVIIGNKQYIKFNKDNYNPNWSKVERVVDINNINKKQKITMMKNNNY